MTGHGERIRVHKSAPYRTSLQPEHRVLGSMATAGLCVCVSETYRICLVFSVVQIMTVVENVLVGGVEAGFNAILHHLTRPWGALQFLDLNTRDAKYFI